MRYQSIKGIDENQTVALTVTEQLVHEFYLAHESHETIEESQIINMMNVNFTAKMDKFLGKYGPFESGYVYKPSADPFLF